MYGLKKIVHRYMVVISLVMLVLTSGFSVQIQRWNLKNTAKASAKEMFAQIDVILSANQEELTRTVEEYAETCLLHADNVAYILKMNPEAIEDVDELKKIAAFVGVDEIHIFDETGKIYAGTEPLYYGYTLDSGEQMAFFKPLLFSKNARLVQEVTPNTAENKPMQYSAIWSEDGTYIVQVGLEPVHIIDATAKNEISYIFSLLKVSSGVDLYAADPETGMIEGSTRATDEGRNLDDVGISMEDAKEKLQGFFADVDGQSSFCVFTVIDGRLVGYVITSRNLYQSLPLNCLIFSLGFALIGLMLIVVVTRFEESYVIRNISRANDYLRSIPEGGGSTPIDIRSSTEFSELSDHINHMTQEIDEKSRQLYELSSRDALTGLYNRIGFENVMAEVQKDQSSVLHSAVLMVDADGLKYINDTYGHESGDAYLRGVAKQLLHFKKKISKKAIISRIGGDEFVVYLYDYRDDETLEKDIQILLDEQDSRRMDLPAGESVDIRFSVGYVLRTDENPDYEDLFQIADQRMYENKRFRKSDQRK